MNDLAKKDKFNLDVQTHTALTQWVSEEWILKSGNQSQFLYLYPLFFFLKEFILRAKKVYLKIQREKKIIVDVRHFKNTLFFIMLLNKLKITYYSLLRKLQIFKNPIFRVQLK